MTTIPDLPERIDLVNELHARPFPTLSAPSRAAYLAVKRPKDAATRSRKADKDHLLDLLRRLGATQMPGENATHYFGEIGKYRLKWESHTEFVTYTLFGDPSETQPFDGDFFDVFPEDWLADLPGQRMTSALIRVDLMKDRATMHDELRSWFVGESLAASSVLDGLAVIATDFRLDSAGHVRMAMFVDESCGARRIGRIVQRLTEIETYKSMSMLGLTMARGLNRDLNGIEDRLSELTDAMAREDAAPEGTLRKLLPLSSELEALASNTGFRFGATGAYEALVHQRVQVLREMRFEGRQTFNEFMMRRFDPAMRTVKSAEKRLEQMTQRAVRASELLRTRVDVDRSAQNQALLESMDRRADLQLRLQKTVEGLSVVAISYYAVSLALYFLGPIAEAKLLSKAWLATLVVPPVVFLVWRMLQRVHKSME